MSSSSKRLRERERSRSPPPKAKKAKNGVLLSPQDVVIECKGKQISTHAAALRVSKYFAAILDVPGRDKDEPIVLPDSFNPSKLSDFVCVLALRVPQRHQELPAGEHHR